MSARISKNYAHVLWRVPALLFWMLFMPLIFFMLRFLKLPRHAAIPHLFHRGVRFILGMRLSVTGQVSPDKPTLYVSNHISYLDVFALGDIPAYFVAKSEVSGWPILGNFAKFQNTIFIERKAGKTKHSLTVLQEHINDSKSLILFPEGTSTNGIHVKPFKSSLFEAVNIKSGLSIGQSAVKKNRIPIQAITIAYTHQAGKKMNHNMRDHYAWYADMPFASHFFKLFALKKVDVKVHFHSVCYLDDFASRKYCADHCQALVTEKLAFFLKQQ